MLVDGMHEWPMFLESSPLQEELRDEPRDRFGGNVGPRWSRCLSNTNEFRIEACRLALEQAIGFQAAFWATCVDGEQRMTHWI